LAARNIPREYPGIICRWQQAWEHIIPFLDFAPEVRRIIYTTNMIEGINNELRKATRNRGHFRSHEALIKVLYVGCTQPGPPAWASAMFPKNQTCALVDNRHMRKPITPNQINMIVNIR
jgi:transposase-like protein